MHELYSSLRLFQSPMFAAAAAELLTCCLAHAGLTLAEPAFLAMP
jgi:hypothetical protein